MKWLNCARTKVLLVVFVAAIVFSSGGNAKADFTFGEPVNLGPAFNSSADDFVDCFSADGLEMYLGSNRAGTYGGWDIWVSRRQTTNDDWGPLEHLLSPINTAHPDCSVSISADGLELYFSSYNRPGGYGNWDIWITRRATKDDAWGIPENLGPVINSSSYDADSSISSDGLELYFGSSRPGGHGSHDLWVSRRATKNDPWGEPVNLGPIVNSSASETITHLSSNGLFLFFSEDYSSPIRPGGFGNIDMWVTRRASISDPWGIPVNLGPIVNTASIDSNPLISPDGSTLYFTSGRPGGFGGTYGWGDIYQATIIPIVDFNGDGVCDIDDLVIMIENWGTNEPLCDIGPTPLGDGIVDDADVEVLMKYWGQEFDDPTLIANWKLDETEGNIAHDSIGEYDGQLYGDPVWQPSGGMVDGALMLDGIDDCVGTWEIPGLSNGDFTMFAWIKGGAPGQVVISEFHGVNWLMADADSGCLKTDLKGTGLADQPLVSEATITDGQWHRVGLSWDGSNRVLIVDDVTVASDMQRNLERSVVELNIGCGPDSTAGTFFSGLIDDVRIYNRAITP